MVWDRNAPYKAESKKIVWVVAPYLKGRGLDIGAGDFKVLPHVISVDNMNHAQFGFQVRPDLFSEADNLDMIASASMDFVYSSHTLEHVVDMEKALKEWWRVIKPTGCLVLYLPHKDFYPNMGQDGANVDHKRDFVPEDVIAAMPAGWDLEVLQERNNDDEYSFLLVFRKLGGKHRTRSCLDPKPARTALVVRYGAFGDLLQASSVFAGLKRQGYHVTLHASNPGAAAVQHDPNIDKIILFDRDQVPNANLVDFWTVQKKMYDKFVNLSESVEGTLLAMPGRAQHAWRPLVRHKMMNKNYLQFQHEIADVPHDPQVKFYPTLEEKAWAKKERDKLGAGPIVLYSLSGSSVHKTWAGLDNILASIMLHFPTARVVLCGGPECVILEQGWENEPRIIKTSGKWSIRQSLSFLDQCDLVIGPETGVLNAASHMPVAKVIFLSHSSRENLTRDWVNAYPIFSKDTECPGRAPGVPACHMMHYNWDHCRRDDSGVAQCMADIPPEQVWGPVSSVLQRHIPKVAA
jgi:ADP-heptose:LPS heptosyltransferase